MSDRIVIEGDQGGRTFVPPAGWEEWARCGVKAYAGVCDLALGNVDALLKAHEIAWRGFAVLQNACNGTLQMTMHESFANARTRMSCQSLSSLLSLERDLTGIGLARITDRAAILGRMIVQTAEDASVPLWHRCVIDLDPLAACRH